MTTPTSRPGARHVSPAPPTDQGWQRAPRQQPPPPQPPVAQPAAKGDSTAVHALRITTYVLTSLASLVFLAMVVYGYLAVQDLRQNLSSNPLFGGGAPSSSSYEVPTQEQICAEVPDAPEC